MIRLLTICLIIVFTEKFVSAQWKPGSELSSIKITEDCSRTKDEMAVVAGPPVLPQKTVFFCSKTASQIDSRSPGASHFFYVHEFAHHALNRMDERLADCWAVKELKKIPNGDYYINAAIKYLKDKGLENHHRYGTMQERSERIAKCASGNETSTKQFNNVFPKNNNSKRIPVFLRIWPGGLGNSGAEMDVYIDGRHIGMISNLLVQETVELGELSPGEHEFKLENIVGYSLDQFGDITPFVSGLAGSGKFKVTEQKTFKLDIRNLAPKATSVICNFR
jgi:hypothetical protein